MARIVGIHFLKAKKRLIRIPMMNTTKGSSIRAVYLPFSILGMRRFSLLGTDVS